MTEVKQWQVQIHIDEHEEHTTARARLATDETTTLVGVGLARLNPADTNVPDIGDELAVSRALSDLAHKLLDAAVSDIEAITHRPSNLSR